MREALETIGAFDAGKALGVIHPKACEQAYDLCDHLSAMLYRWR